MSNIEPTVTRTMHCTICNAVGVHTIDASMRNEAVLCPACAESGKRSACVAVEPTEEQKQAARDLYNNLLIDFNMGADIRPPEAQHERVRGMWIDECRSTKALNATVDTLRARVAELEADLGVARADFATVVADLADAQKREAQHLADIKALHQFLGDHEEEEGIWIPRSEFKDVPCRKYLAHYDDAKAGAPATCPKCTDDARPVGDGERWVCSVCRRPCRVPLNDAEGGEG